MPEKPEDIPLRTEYATKVAEDLERNEAEQERVRSEMAELEARLAALQREHALLLNMRNVLTDEANKADKADEAASRAADDAPEAGAEAPAAVVPKARRSRNDGARTRRGGGKNGNGKNGARKNGARKNGARKNTGPTLRELVRSCLLQRHEPLSVADITKELAAAHPDRTVTTPVVRNTLEALVAAGAVERSKQRKSVFYTAVTAEPAAGTAAVETVEEAATADV